jgi:UDP-2,4-diacetamido-2,4,6-trideoxy-beta-L-altropyranose hydrolase
MTGMRVLFYARANGPIGGGHIARCLTLLQAFERIGQDCTFAYLEGSEQIVPALRDYHCRKIVIPQSAWGDAG